MLRRALLPFVAGFIAAIALPAAAQQKQVWKASDVHPLGYPTVEAIERMGKKLEKGTNGRISIQMFPSMQLGGEKEMIEQAQVGALQIARISVGPMGPIVDELNVFNMPFVFKDEAQMRKVIDGPFAETKEQLGGFHIIDVPDLDAALDWAARCPSASRGLVEVRPLWPVEEMSLA